MLYFCQALISSDINALYLNIPTKLHHGIKKKKRSIVNG